MPPQEQAFVEIIDRARQRFHRAGTPADRANVRLAMQNEMLRFVGRGLEAANWTGVIKDVGALKDGSLWLAVEIPDGIELTTRRALEQDPHKITIIGPRSALFEPLRRARIGEKVRFSGAVIHAVVASDDEMVNAPQFFVRFSRVELLH